MEQIGKDPILLIALELDFIDILRLCSTSKFMNRIICNNTTFWAIKFYKNYPFLKDIIIPDDFGKLYKYIEFKRNEILKNIEPDILNDYSQGSYVKPEIIEFLKNSDLGFIPEYNYSINYLIRPLVESRIFNRPILTRLFLIYLYKNKRNFNKNGEVHFSVDDNIEHYFNTILDKKEKQTDFNRYSFNYNESRNLIYKTFIKSNKLAQIDTDILNSGDMDILLSKISKVLYNFLVR